MQSTNIVTQVNFHTAALVRKGFLDGRFSTGQFQFWQQLHAAAIKVLNTRNSAIDQLPYPARSQQITINSQGKYRHKALTNQFCFLLHIPSAQLSLLTATCFFDSRPQTTICWKATEGEIPGALFFYKELQQRYYQNPLLSPRPSDFPSAGKGKGP